ncbi:hypothetical protein WR25_06782 [Diploscapter pachys]|uniref:Uncharacterized protein n=1 Tax=Diploscapter pachys TaxID=2018661 RepID=A0A2A2KDY7_9BILA|nr:hypothetical protein WR25_06782 [Diploscapter pachys]
MISIDTKQVTDLVSEDRWYMKIIYFVGDNWIALLLAVILFTLANTLFNKWAVPYLYEFFKKILGYESTLEEMRSLLEHDYGDLWQEKKFIIEYLKLSKAYVNFLNVACSDHKDRTRPVSLYNQFRDVQVAK